MTPLDILGIVPLLIGITKSLLVLPANGLSLDQMWLFFQEVRSGVLLETSGADIESATQVLEMTCRNAMAEQGQAA